MLADKIERVSIAALKPSPHNARTHPKRQIEQIAASIQRFGFLVPVLVDDDLAIIAGHGRSEAAALLGMTEVPVIRVARLSEAEKRAFMLADNRLTEKARWDKAMLALELKSLIDLRVDMGAIGFEPPEIDIIIGEAEEADAEGPQTPEDDVPAPPAAPVTRPGDVWICGRHKLICADARDEAAYAALMAGERAAAIFTDPPYNVPIDGFVGGKGKLKRREFAMASGEMSEAQFVSFLRCTLGPAAARLMEGGVAFVCMDWRHMGEVQSAGRAELGELLNLCIWTKSNGGMGSLYRSQHELVFVFKKAGGAHVNNVELGRHGRNRTNVWAYAGVNAFGAARDAELAMHPTVKPVALIEDALKDVTRRGDIVLDPFGGSGSTLIAAHKCGRSARLIELDPAYCDVIVKRYEAYTGKSAILAGTGESFEAVAARSGSAAQT